MIISRVEVSRKIPTELREVYGRLAGAVIDTLGCYSELVTLFGSQETVTLLNATAPTFFLRHQQLLIDNMILSLSRLTDTTSSGPRKNPQENLTLAQLIDLREPEYDQLRADLKKKWTTIAAAAKPIRLYRHKLLAHASLVHYLSPSTKLGEKITMTSMKDLIDEILDYLSTFDCFFTGVDTPLSYPPSYGEAEDLIPYLRSAVNAETKLNDERRRAALESSSH
jgi:hypothetical protein